MSLNVYQALILRESNTHLILLYHFLLGLPEYCFLQSLVRPPGGDSSRYCSNLCIDFPSISNCKSSTVSIKLLEHCLCSSSVCPLNGGSDRLLHAVFTMGNNILTLDGIIQLWVGNDDLVGISGVTNLTPTK